MTRPRRREALYGPSIEAHEQRRGIWHPASDPDHRTPEGATHVTRRDIGTPETTNQDKKRVHTPNPYANPPSQKRDDSVQSPEIHNRMHAVQGEHSLRFDLDMARHRRERDESGRTDGERLGQGASLQSDERDQTSTPPE